MIAAILHILSAPSRWWYIALHRSGLFFWHRVREEHLLMIRPADALGAHFCCFASVWTTVVVLLVAYFGYMPWSMAFGALALSIIGPVVCANLYAFLLLNRVVGKRL